MSPTQVLVTGAGPTGLTLACGLAAQGIAVTVVDAAPGPATTSRANILHARGVEVLTRVGALGDLPAHSLAPVGMTMHARGKALTTMRFAPDPTEATQALFISQATIEAELRRRLVALGVRVEWNRRLTGAVADAEGVTVAFADGSSTRTDWLAGCDGAHSTVRELAGIDFPGVPVVERFLLADVRADWDRDRSTSSGWFHKDGMVLAMPMRDAGGGLWRLMADVPATDDRLDAEQIVARLEQLLPQRTGDTGLRIRETLWTSVFRIQRRLADSYRAGRVLLAGDAAHIHSPIGGQGMNTGMGDAENLAWKLALVASGRAAEALLDTYTAERRPLATEVLKRTTTNTRVLVGPDPISRAFRDLVFVPLLNLPAVQRAATRNPSQLWVTYRDGPLGSRGKAPRPGDRIPDRDCTAPDGTTTRLYTHLGPAWVVLSRNDSPVTDAVAVTARRHLGKDVATLHAPTSPDDILVIRPDGHLGWRGDDPAKLAQWLTDNVHTRESP